MSISFLKESRTKYRNLLEKGLEKGRRLIEEATQEQCEIKIFSKSLSNCINRLNDIIETLKQTYERLSIVVHGQDGAQEVEQLITEDWSYIAEVVDRRYELEDIQQALQDQKSPQENFSLMRVKEGNFKQMIQSTAQMHQILVDNEQLQQHRLQLAQPSTGGENCNSWSDSTGGEDCNSWSDSTGGENCNSRSDSTSRENCFSRSDSRGGENCKGGSESTCGENGNSGSDSTGGEDCNSWSESTGSENCYSQSDSTGGENYNSGSESTCGENGNSGSDITGGEDCNSWSDSTGSENCYSRSDSTGGENCNSGSDSTGDEICNSGSDSTGGKNCYSGSDITGSENCNKGLDSTCSENNNSRSDSTGGEDCCSLKVSRGPKDFVSFETNSIDTYYSTCETGKIKGADISIFRIATEVVTITVDLKTVTGGNEITTKPVATVKPKFIVIDKYKQKVEQLQRLEFIIVAGVY